MARRDTHRPARRRIALALLATVVLGLGIAWEWQRMHAKGGLVALDVRTGATRWRVSAPTGSAHIHAVGPSQVVVSGADSCNPPSGETIASYALADGARRWKEPWRGVCFDYGSATAVVDGMFVIDGRPGPELVRARDGSIARALVAPSGAVATPPGVVTLDGDDVAARRLAGGPASWTAHVSGRPTLVSVDARAVLLIGDPFRLTALDRRTGAHLWQRGLPFVGGYDGLMAGADGVIAISGPTAESLDSPHETYAIDERTGRGLWKRRARPGPSTPLLAVGGDLALFVDRGSHGSPTIVAVGLRNDRTRWTVRPHDLSAQLFEATFGGGVAVVTDGHRIEALSEVDGATRWSRRWPSGTPGAGRLVIAGGLVLVPYTRDGFPFADE